jgi:hypothetical protein
MTTVELSDDLLDDVFEVCRWGLPHLCGATAEKDAHCCATTNEEDARFCDTMGGENVCSRLVKAVGEDARCPAVIRQGPGHRLAGLVRTGKAQTRDLCNSSGVGLLINRYPGVAQGLPLAKAVALLRSAGLGDGLKTVLRFPLFVLHLGRWG